MTKVSLPRWMIPETYKYNGDGDVDVGDGDADVGDGDEDVGDGGVDDDFKSHWI